MSKGLTTATNDSGTSTDSVESRILDAALVQFEKQGFKKTTIEDIARQASVDRVTVYRRIGSRDDVVKAVTAREVQRVVVELAEFAGGFDTADDLVAGLFAAVVNRWRTHPFAQRMLSMEPERALGQLTTEGGAPFTMTVAAMVAILHDATTRGLFPELPDQVARVEIVCRIVHSFILQPVGTIPMDSDAELEAFARRYLVPILNPES
ncbi:TetR/AcrR family transcriptional regulator [Aldersonia kunmingensis]|uniref:TetR/AcrR family transcriptional regulator n=1 Tax=Aldersonia kunmingensis TaxID=408066 RepID=UPI000A75A3B4|nr:TetR/AcrR family transcriptional regulator [Aldersonia kunmingensis]